MNSQTVETIQERIIRFILIIREANAACTARALASQLQLSATYVGEVLRAMREDGLVTWTEMPGSLQVLASPTPIVVMGFVDDLEVDGLVIGNGSIGLAPESFEQLPLPPELQITVAELDPVAMVAAQIRRGEVGFTIPPEATVVEARHLQPELLPIVDEAVLTQVEVAPPLPPEPAPVKRPVRKRAPKKKKPAPRKRAPRTLEG